MWPNPQETADLVTFTEEILNGKLHFLCSIIARDVFGFLLNIYDEAFSLKGVNYFCKNVWKGSRCTSESKSSH